MNGKITRLKKRIAAGCLLLLATVSAQEPCGDACRIEAEKTQAACDDLCRIEAGVPQASSEPIYAVVSPVGRATVKMIEQAPRLPSPDGKTHVPGGGPMASVTHPEIRRLILQNYPTARVILLSEIGAAGIWPASGVTRRAKESATCAK